MINHPTNRDATMRHSIARPPRPLLAAAVAALVATACNTQPEQPEPLSLVGCHYFEQDDHARALRLPWGVELRDEPLRGGWPIQQRGDVRRAITLTGQSAEDHPFGYWLRAGDSGVEVGYPAGGGLVLRLELRDGQLAGTARPVGDAIPLESDGPDRAARPVALVRARCPDG